MKATNHRLREHSGLEETLKTILCPQVPTPSPDTIHQNTLLQVRDVAAVTSLCNLLQRITILTVSNFFLVTDLILPSFT